MKFKSGDRIEHTRYPIYGKILETGKEYYKVKFVDHNGLYDSTSDCIESKDYIESNFKGRFT